MELQHTEKTGAVSNRREPMVRVKVVNRNMNQTVAPGINVPHGEHVIRVFASEVPVILAMVEKDAGAVQRAQDDYEREMKLAIEKGCEGLDGLEREHEEKKIRQTIALSPAGMFHRNQLRDMLPLISAEVVEEGIPAPIVADKAESESALAGMIAKAMASEVAKAIPEVIRALTANHGQQNNSQQQFKKS